MKSSHTAETREASIRRQVGLRSITEDSSVEKMKIPQWFFNETLMLLQFSISKMQKEWRIAPEIDDIFIKQTAILLF